MEFDTFLADAWRDHADDPAVVAARLPAGAAAVETEAQWLALAHIAHHLQAQHLGAWDEARQALATLARHPAYRADGPSGQAHRRFQAAVDLCDGSAPAAVLAPLGPSDRVRAQALAAASLLENTRAPDAVGAAALWSTALDDAAHGSLPTDDPLHRTLAATGNGIACTLEDRASRSAGERALMLSAAQAARTHWALAGTWLEVERADYRLAMSRLCAGDPAQALVHAQACLDGIGDRADTAFERFYAWEAIALAQRALGDDEAAASAVDAAWRACDELAPDDRADCETALRRLTPPTPDARQRMP